MAQSHNKDCCYLCDTYLNLNSEDKPLGFNQYEVQTSLISTVKKFLPNISECQLDHICQSCLKYITDFNEVRTKWENNELIIKSKRQLGRFKGLRDIVHPKYTSSHICRLCLKETHTQQVTFVYHEDQVYQTGYVQKILSTHSPHTDLSLTENPIICNECLDTIQTFDAFHQMWLQAQSTKTQTTDQVKNTEKYGNSEVDSSENIVHLQLCKTSDNTAIVRTLTEAESAVSGLQNIKDPVTDKSKGIINAWTTKKFLNLVHNRKSKVMVKENEDDVFVISDDDEIETQSLEIDTTQIEGRLNTDKERVEILPQKGNISCYSSEPCDEQTHITLADTSDYAEEFIDALPIKTTENSNEVTFEINMSQVKNVLESNYPIPTQNFDKILDYRKNLVESINKPTFMSKNRIILANDPTLKVNEEELNQNSKLTEPTLVGAKEFTFVEVDDSDSQNSDDVQEIVAPILPIITKLTYLNETFEHEDRPMVEINMAEEEQIINSEENDEKIIDCDQDAGFLGINNEHNTDQAAVITPSIEINMTKVNELFQASIVNDLDESTVSVEEDIIPSIEINMAKVDKIFNDAKDKTSTKNNELEQNLSGFLQFNKNEIIQQYIEKPDELLDFQESRPGLEKSITNSPEVKKRKVKNVVSAQPKTNNLGSCRDTKTFTSAFEEFLQKERKTNYANIYSLGGLSKNRRKLYRSLKSVEQIHDDVKTSKNVTEIIVSDDDSDHRIEDDYCKWFPYEQHVLEKSQGKLFNKTKKVDATVLESRSGTRLYRCNICLLAVRKEYDLFNHGCVKVKGKMWYACNAKRCSFSTHDKNQLSQHELFHTLDDISWHKCNICEFHASDENLIVHHYKQCHQTGTVEKNSKCPHCFFESDIPDILSHHISARHALAKNKQHSDCNSQPINNLSNLNDQSFKKYICEYCKFFCYTKRSMGQHIRYEHPI